MTSAMPCLAGHYSYRQQTARPQIRRNSSLLLVVPRKHTLPTQQGGRFGCTIAGQPVTSCSGCRGSRLALQSALACSLDDIADALLCLLQMALHRHSSLCNTNRSSTVGNCILPSLSSHTSNTLVQTCSVCRSGSSALQTALARPVDDIPDAPDSQTSIDPGTASCIKLHSDAAG